jgi:HD-like signal output (HDOD) protein
VVKDYIEQLKDIPMMPEVSAKVVRLTEDKLDISFRQLENIIKTDPGLTAKILKIANSALYARQREIKNLQMAITLLGFKNIKSLVLLITASGFFPHMRKAEFFRLYWAHSLVSGFLARKLAIRCNRNDICEEAFLAGLLHDIGQPVLYGANPTDYEAVLEEDKEGAVPLETIEEKYFGANHREVGGALLKKWNFPDIYADTALEHESVNITSPHKSLIIFASVACLLSEPIVYGRMPEYKREILAKLQPYTCLGAGEMDGFAAAANGDLRKDPLFKEFQSLLGAG